MKSSITVSLVREACGGPFVFWDDLAGACRAAAELGFDAIEIFPPSAAALDRRQLQTLLDDCGLQLAAVGTGGGWVLRRLTLTDPDPARRAEALQFVRQIIDMAGPFRASAIIGSMQGRWTEQVDRTRAMELLRAALAELGEVAATTYGVPLIYEPLNRYETNLCNTLAAGAALLQELPPGRVVLLADLFHMNIEEQDVGAALRQAGPYLGHVHFVDSNRRAAGMGHLDYGPIAAALRAMNYRGYLSAEALPWPDSATAARSTIDTFRRDFCG